MGQGTTGRAVRAATVVAALALLTVIVRHAWVSDDAYITFRAVDNLVHGRGLSWNVGERVQSYTHPLWMFVVAVGYVVTREPFYTSIALSLALVAATAWLVGRHARGGWAGPVVLLGLAASQAFVDYSTSGLENALTHALLAAFFLVFLDGETAADPRRILRLSLLACLAVLNRLDLGLLVAPALLQALWASRRPRFLLTVALGFTPLIAWELFSILYYGVPFPNTAYAKLATGIAGKDLAAQGWRYFHATLLADPVTLGLVALGSAAGLARRGRHAAVAVGLLLYAGYIVKIGGDFMLGRFFSAPLLVAVVLLARPWGNRWIVPAALAAVVAGAAGYARLPTVTGVAIPRRDGVGDERAFYAANNGLFGKGVAGHPMAVSGQRARGLPGRTAVFWAVGMSGMYAGPDKHVIDHYALTDPLLARQPAQRTFAWRIGHFARYLPDGYLETLETGENRLVDPALRRRWDDLALVTRGPLFSSARLAAIWRLNTGGLPEIDRKAYAYPAWRLIQAAVLRLEDGKPDPKPEIAGPTPASLLIRFDRKRKEPRFVLRVEPERTYRVAFLSAVDDASLEGGAVTLGPGARDVVVEVPARAVTIGYDTLKIVPLDGRGPAKVLGWRDAP